MLNLHLIANVIEIVDKRWRKNTVDHRVNRKSDWEMTLKRKTIELIMEWNRKRAMMMLSFRFCSTFCNWKNFVGNLLWKQIIDDGAWKYAMLYIKLYKCSIKSEKTTRTILIKTMSFEATYRVVAIWNNDQWTCTIPTSDSPSNLKASTIFYIFPIELCKKKRSPKLVSLMVEQLPIELYLVEVLENE